MSPPRIARADLENLLDAGLNLSEAARRLGVSSTAVSSARSRWGIAYAGRQGPAPIIPRQAFMALLDAGMTPSEIARQIGCHPTSACQRAERIRNRR